MNFMVIEGQILPKVTRAHGSITANQLSENEAASASSLNVSAVSKKKIMESRRKLECYERERLPKMSPDYSSSSDSSLYKTTASLHF